MVVEASRTSNPDNLTGQSRNCTSAEPHTCNRSGLELARIDRSLRCGDSVCN